MATRFYIWPRTGKEKPDSIFYVVLSLHSYFLLYYRNNKINWIADINGVADISTGDTIKNYILSQPTEIVDDKNVISVGNNNIYVSDYISTFPIQFDVVDDLSGLPDLLDSTTQVFQDYSDAFCNDVSYVTCSCLEHLKYVWKRSTLRMLNNKQPDQLD